MVLSFALIAMDSSITLDLRREIRVVIDTIISNLPTLEQVSRVTALQVYVMGIDFSS